MDLTEFRNQFPALERYVWLNTPTAPPGATPILRALRDALDSWEAGDFSWQGWEAEGFAARGIFARLIGVPDHTTALVASVAEAASTVAASLPPGRIVVGAREFQSNLFPWLALRDRGTHEVTEVPERDGVIPTQALIDAVDDRTVLVAVSEVQSSNGYRVDVRALAEACQAHDARLFVNLTQALGVLRFDASTIRPDFVAAHAYKWLLGPRGAAYFHVREDRIAELSPLTPNWHSIPEPYSDYYGGPVELAPGARGLDTSISWLPWVGSRAALELIASLEADAVERRGLELARSFRDLAEARGFQLVTAEVPSQIVAVRVQEPDALRERLKERGVLGAVRDGQLRLGFHGFNTEDDVEAAMEALGKES